MVLNVWLKEERLQNTAVITVENVTVEPESLSKSANEDREHFIPSTTADRNKTIILWKQIFILLVTINCLAFKSLCYLYLIQVYRREEILSTPLKVFICQYKHKTILVRWLEQIISYSYLIWWNIVWLNKNLTNLMCLLVIKQLRNCPENTYPISSISIEIISQRQLS